MAFCICRNHLDRIVSEDQITLNCGKCGNVYASRPEDSLIAYKFVSSTDNSGDTLSALSDVSGQVMLGVDGHDSLLAQQLRARDKLIYHAHNDKMNQLEKITCPTPGCGQPYMTFICTDVVVGYKCKKCRLFHDGRTVLSMIKE